MYPSDSPHIAIVVSPLKALMMDQVERCRKIGITAVALRANEDMTEEDKKCRLTSF